MWVIIRNLHIYGNHGYTHLLFIIHIHILLTFYILDIIGNFGYFGSLTCRWFICYCLALQLIATSSVPTLTVGNRQYKGGWDGFYVLVHATITHTEQKLILSFCNIQVPVALTGKWWLIWLRWIPPDFWGPIHHHSYWWSELCQEWTTQTSI